ncbi:head completion/stabilization protein [Xenophilus aerolatus]
MTLIAAAPPLVRTTPPTDPAPLGKVSAGEWWPDIDLAALRDAMRLDGTITPARLLHATQEAVASTIAALGDWAQARQQVDGRAKLEDVPAPQIDNESILVQRFRRAVYCHAKANLIERYSDYDTTGRERRKDQDDARADQAEQHRRDATWAIRDILGVPRLNVELI